MYYKKREKLYKLMNKNAQLALQQFSAINKEIMS